MTIFLGTDHAGFELKAYIAEKLAQNGFTVVDCGAKIFDPEDDYPVFIRVVAQEVSKDPQNARGIIFGGSGQGEAIAANRHAGVRAAVYYGGPIDIVRLSREHNDANILSFGARFVTPEDAWTAVSLWLQTSFTHEERHVRRNDAIELQ